MPFSLPAIAAATKAIIVGGFGGVLLHAGVHLPLKCIGPERDKDGEELNWDLQTSQQSFAGGAVGGFLASLYFLPHYGLVTGVWPVLENSGAALLCSSPAILLSAAMPGVISENIPGCLLLLTAGTAVGGMMGVAPLGALTCVIVGCCATLNFQFANAFPVWQARRAIKDDEHPKALSVLEWITRWGAQATGNWVVVGLGIIAFKGYQSHTVESVVLPAFLSWTQLMNFNAGIERVGSDDHPVMGPVRNLMPFLILPCTFTFSNPAVTRRLNLLALAAAACYYGTFQPQWNKFQLEERASHENKANQKSDSEQS